MSTPTFLSECSTPDIIASVVVLLINLIFITVSIPMIYIYVHTYYLKNTLSKGSIQRQKSTPQFNKTVTPKPLFYSGLLYSIISFITLLFSIPFNFHCDEHWIFDVFTSIFSVFYVLHCYLLLVLWFLRIYYVFRSTQFKLSKCIVYIYVFLLIVMPFILCSAVILLSSATTIGLIIYLLMLILFFVFLSSLVALFIHKLVKIYKNLAKNHKFIGIITRSTILTMITLGFVIFYGILLFIRTTTDNLLVKYLRNMIQLISIFVDLACVLLSYTYFDIYYLKLCHKIDTKCTNLWYFIVGDIKHPNIDDTSKAISKRSTVIDQPDVELEPTYNHNVKPTALRVMTITATEI